MSLRRSAYLLVTACCLAFSLPASGQEEEEEEVRERATTERQSLADRIPAVTGRFVLKAGRVELAPMFGFSINDPFWQHLTVGVSAGFHILEQLSVGVSGEWFGNLHNHVQVTGGEQITRKYDRPTYAARIDLSWAPVYGKLSLMAETVLHFDTYLTAAGGVVGPLRSDVEFCWGGAVGQRYFLNEWIALRVELRTQFYEMSRQPARDPNKSLQVLLTGTIGVSFFLPAEVARETL